MIQPDRNVDAAGCLGRALGLLGLLWLGFALLAGFGTVSQLGWSPIFVTGVGATIVPALLLIALGRVIRRRSAGTDRTTSPGPPVRKPSAGPAPATRVKRVPTPPIIPGKSGSRPAPTGGGTPRPTGPAPGSIFPVPEAGSEPTEPGEPVPGQAGSPESTPGEQGSTGSGHPKTSQELIDEAHKRWSSGGGR